MNAARALAEKHVNDRFTPTGCVTTHRGRCYEAWTETWQRRDGQPVAPADIEAFSALPRGQGHRVTADGSVVTLHCELDSGD